MSGWSWLRGVGLPPWGRGMPPIAVGHYECSRCRSLCGGISGKGPWKRFAGEGAAECRHAWREISLGEFRELATGRYGVDWAGQGEWWRREG